MQNVGYSLNAKPHSGAGDEVHGVLMLRDGTMLGGDFHVYYTGSYECSQGTWQRKSRQQTQTGRPGRPGWCSTVYPAAPTRITVRRSMQWPSSVSKLFDTIQRCVFSLRLEYTWRALRKGSVPKSRVSLAFPALRLFQ
jgi:hypothetical protein